MVMGELGLETDLLVIGGGPGGYAAAFRAADLGLEVALVDNADRPGGECLYRGCIPSKTLLYLSELIYKTRNAAGMGLRFEPPRIDLEGIRNWKRSVINTLADGLATLGEKRGIQFIRGRTVFESPKKVRVYDSEVSHIKFKHAIIATGSRPAPFQGTDFREGGRIMDSTGALEMADIPEKLLIVGGGYVALEMGTVYAGLGSRVTVAVRSERLLRGADPDLAVPLIRSLKERFAAIHFNTLPETLEETKDHVDVIFQGGGEKGPQRFDRVLVATGRQPNSGDVGLENTRVRCDEKGFIIVDETRRTSDERIFAVGDVAGAPLLAHKAFHEGKVAAEVIAGRPSAFEARAIPAVVYTDPQVAWCGLTEEQARKKKIPVKIERYPWKFSSRAITMGASNGLTKLILDTESGRVLGVGITGPETEGMISEGVLAVEMGALAEDVGLSIHPHPTLSETFGEAAEIFTGSATHILNK